MNIPKSPPDAYFYWLLKINSDLLNLSYSEQDKVWVSHYTELKNTGIKKNLPKSFALVHPDFYRKNGENFYDNIPWKTTNSFKAGITDRDVCNYKHISGTDCVFNELPEIRGICEADHYWPKYFRWSKSSRE